MFLNSYYISRDVFIVRPLYLKYTTIIIRQNNSAAKLNSWSINIQNRFDHHFYCGSICKINYFGITNQNVSRILSYNIYLPIFYEFSGW